MVIKWNSDKKEFFGAQKTYMAGWPVRQYRSIANTPPVADGAPTVRCDDLTREQARALKNKLQPMLGYLGRLKDRMRRRGFLQDDPLLAAVCRAEDAMHALTVEVHYLACGDSVGRRGKEK
jgi:hypothetical protein